jgi:dTDP-4-dehydrorhamnose 3,5-epimerase-like enzyme
MRFVNDFDMSRVVRMYCIEPKLLVVRAWQGHKKETKWFYVANGRFLVKTSNMESQEVLVYKMASEESQVLQIPGGNYNGFEALEEGSVLMVFSDFGLEESKRDDCKQSLENIKW